jgi:AbrB family looped-hinge helix DNA binding protein
METVTLSTKGQLVLPKRVRDALRLKPGQRLSVAVENHRIVLEPSRPGEPAAPAWQPVNPAGAKLSTADLCRPVDIKREAGRR